MKTTTDPKYCIASILIVAVTLVSPFANAQPKAGEGVAQKSRAPILLLPGGGEPDGEQNRWKVTAVETLGAYSLRYSVHGADGPPLHTHTNEDEAWYALEGELSFQMGDRTLVGSPGSFVFSPRGIHHRYWNSGGTTAKFLMMFSPGGLEKMFQERGTVPGRDRSKSSAGQSAEVKEAFKTLSAKYGVRENPGPSGDRPAIFVPPGGPAANSQSSRVTISGKDTLGAFSIIEFKEPRSVQGPFNEMKEDAGWYVIDGELTFEFGDRKFVAPQDAFVLLPRGTRHRVSSGQTPTRYLLIRSPG